ncbi:alanine racemase [Pseudonocardia acaciae]|uniref:alanine racemase n=1 Tax=Pseudonocardia acaciae TaxID=551276 RepID=UPI00048E1E7A|nr:alanine racemase [Pseudonocardia acaciae]
MSGTRAVDPGLLAELSEHRLTGLEKGLPASARGRTVAEFLAAGPRLSQFHTPLLALDASALDENLARMASWCAERGVGLAPHGKTTMAPALWDRQLRAGAWGITVANAPQLRVALRFGVPSVQLANELVDPSALAELADALRADPGLTVHTWVDSVDTVGAMDAALTSTGVERPLTVLVELGAPGGRTGARDADAAHAVAKAVNASPYLVLGGVCGYEGALAHDRSPDALEAVRRYLRELAELHTALREGGRYEVDVAVVTAGGSSFFDEVTDALAPLAGPDTLVLLRSGAYLIHDDGFYSGISPFARSSPFHSAMHAWARVLSRPEPGLALLDVGKRDVPFDEGLPRPQLVADDLGAPTTPLAGEVTAVNDQHAFVRLGPDTPLRVGQVVRLGLSHPCTAFDKWRWIPVLSRDGDGEDPLVVDLVRTYF